MITSAGLAGHDHYLLSVVDFGRKFDGLRLAIVSSDRQLYSVPDIKQQLVLREQWHQWRGDSLRCGTIRTERQDRQKNLLTSCTNADKYSYSLYFGLLLKHAMDHPV